MKITRIDHFRRSGTSGWMMRRKFLKLMGVLSLSGRSMAKSAGDQEGSPTGGLSFGIIADLHHGLATDAMQRLEVFMQHVEEKKPDFLIQLGDFCFGGEESDELLARWNRFKGPKYHVLGNHDMDRHSKKFMVNYLGMPGRYYHFEQGAMTFIVLDCNNIRLPEGKFIDYDSGNYFRHPEGRGYVDPEQLEWLEKTLEGQETPVVILSHQGMADGVGTRNQEEVRQIVSRHNTRHPDRRVLMFFEGHHHVDRLSLEDGVHHHWVNSASYHWVGPEYGRMADYEDSLFAFVRMEGDGTVHISGRKSKFRSPTPVERGFPRAGEITARIEDRKIRVSG
jgi:3',5'-cyclic AMP phosphodiesterase CpdA